jgi:hypothetical protein
MALAVFMVDLGIALFRRHVVCPINVKNVFEPIPLGKGLDDADEGVNIPVFEIVGSLERSLRLAHPS